MPPLFPLTLALYAVSCALYLATVGLQQPGAEIAALPRAARLCLLLAVCSQGVDIGWLCLQGQSPPSEAREAVFFASWLIAGVYLLTTLRSHLPVVGALVLPVALVLQIASRLAPAGAPEAPSSLRSIHILAATLGTAIFAVGAGGSVVYLLVERQLKRRVLGKLGRRGPALETLDTLNRQAILLGFPVFTLALLTGAAFLGHLLREGAQLLTLLGRPQYALAVVTWLLFAGLLVGRVGWGLRGRRAALLTLYGFGAALSVLGVYFLRGLHRVSAS